MTPNKKLASILLERDVDDWITEQREAGLSWHKIALALHVATGGQIDVTGEAIRLWGTAA